MNYEKWLESVPEEITGDSLWKMEAYRLALFASDIGWYDVTKLMRDRRTLGLADQLYEALGSVSANIAEGYSRGTGRDRVVHHVSRFTFHGYDHDPKTPTSSTSDLAIYRWLNGGLSRAW